MLRLFFWLFDDADYATVRSSKKTAPVDEVRSRAEPAPRSA